MDQEKIKAHNIITHYPPQPNPNPMFYPFFLLAEKLEPQTPLSLPFPSLTQTLPLSPATSRIRNGHARTGPLALVQIPHEFRDVGAVGLIKREEGVAARGVRHRGHGEVGTREALGAVDDKLVGLTRGDGGVFGGEADVEAADGEVRVLDVEVVGVAHGAVLEDGDVDVACEGVGTWSAFFFLSDLLFLFLSFCLHFPKLTFAWRKGKSVGSSLTVCPLIDRMGTVSRQRRVQFLPQYVEFVLQVDEKHICVARRSPGITAHAGVAVVPIEDLLLGPFVGPVGPAHGIKGGGVLPVPEMDADGLIGAVGRSRRLPGDRGMAVGGVAVEAPVPASLEADVGVIHGLQVEAVDGSRRPDVGGVTVDDLGDGIVDVDVENMPLFQYKPETCFQTQFDTYSRRLISGVGYSGYGSPVFGIDRDDLSDIPSLPNAIRCQLRRTYLAGVMLEVQDYCSVPARIK